MFIAEIFHFLFSHAGKVKGLSDSQRIASVHRRVGRNRYRERNARKDKSGRREVDQESSLRGENTDDDERESHLYFAH